MHITDTYINLAETGLYYLGRRYYDPEIGRFISADTTDVLTVSTTALTDKNLYAYCDNNPVVRRDESGAIWEIVFDVVSLGASIMDVATNPKDPWAWAGLIGDAIDLIPVVTGASEVIRGLKTVNKIDDISDVANRTENVSNFITGACFIAGTLVLSSAGYMPIEDIDKGDKVWSENPETGEKKLKEVVHTFVNKTDELVHVFVDGEEIVATPKHPFYASCKGWTEAIQLRAGDILVLQSGKYVIVEKVQHEILEAPIAVYSFEVEDFHTYYVGRSSILVHNMCQMSKSVDDIIGNLKETTSKKGITRNFESSGGYQQTLKDFAALRPNNVKPIQTKYGSGKVGILPFGGKVVARQGSKTGGATLEIMISNTKQYKIRY